MSNLSSDWVDVLEGDSPVILASPHSGTYVPAPIFDRLNDRGKALADTDWHIDRVYDDILPGASRVRALFHRYVIDPNRDPSGESLYPGQNTTGLIPTVDFEGQGIWKAGAEPRQRYRRALTAFPRPLSSRCSHFN